MAILSHPPDPGRLEKAIARLPAIERDVLLLSAKDGFSTEEISRRLGLPKTAVERHLADALVDLDRLLERQRAWWRFW